MIVIKVMERDMIVTTTSRITSGSVNLPVKFDFKGDEWEDLVKTAVFIGSGEERDVALITDECAVPADVLTEAGGDLKIGVYGRLANGATVIPTIWGRVQYIYEGTEMGEPSPHSPEPDWTAQVQQAAATALTKAQAVEEAAARGDFDGVSPEVTIDTITHGHSVTITDEEHPEGQSFPVLDGASAYEQAVAGGYTGTEAQFNQELKSFKTLSEQAAGSATQAAGSASAAAGSASAAAGSETAAAGSASAAAGAASAAAGSASAAEQSAIDAAAAAEATGGSETAAAASATAAAASATAAADSATAAEEHEYDAEAWADGERNGSPVGSADKTYHNNAKYYAQQAGASATAAGQSVDAAAASATAAADSATAAAGSASAAETAKTQAEAAKTATETARDTAVSTLQTEGAAQRTAIQQKGQEVLESIPSDYTDLSDDVDDLKSALSQCSNAIFGKIEWKNNYVCDNGQFKVSSYDKTTGPIFLQSGDTIEVKTKGDGYYVFNAISQVKPNPSATLGMDFISKIAQITNNNLNTYAYTATEDVYVSASVLMDSTSSLTVTHIGGGNIKENKEAIEALSERVVNCENQLFYQDTKTLDWVENLCVNAGNFQAKKGDKVSKPFTLYAGETVNIKTKGDGSYWFTAISKVPSLDIVVASGRTAGTAIAVIDTNSLKQYSHTATEDEYIVLSASNDQTTTVTFENLKVFSAIEEINKELGHETGILKNKSIMFFGDSLTAADRVGLIGFAERIANNYDMPYKAFVYDSGDGSTSDVPVDFPRFTNYAKDGTLNRIVQSRTDSVLERVKRHVTEDTLIDYVLIECCVNDMAVANRNKGEISASYTATYDTTTTIGAIEETLRYLTTLNNQIRIGGFIPWTIGWQTDGWFDDYIPVFEKWGVPLFDMRKVSGFDMEHCAAHRLRYSLSADAYSAYDPTATYNLDDKVKYGGILYKCASNNVTGIPPTNSEYWIEVSSEDADGTHLNNVGHFVVAGKIQKFIERL